MKPQSKKVLKVVIVAFAKPATGWHPAPVAWCHRVRIGQMQCLRMNLARQTLAAVRAQKASEIVCAIMDSSPVPMARHALNAQKANLTAPGDNNASSVGASTIAQTTVFQIILKARSFATDFAKVSQGFK
jgi:hypothetical protein